MYCGSCLRDNALASEIRAMGHDLLLLPVYTPTLTDETNLSHDRVFLGGISVYLQQRFPLFRRTPIWLDRLWDSGPLLRWASQRAVGNQAQLLGELTVSMLRGDQGFQAKEIAKLLHWVRTLPPPDIVALPNSLLIGLARPLREALGCPIACALQGEDLFLQGLPSSHRQTALELIRSQISQVDAFLAASSFHAASMRDLLGIPPARLQVTPIGINTAAYPARGPKREGAFVVGYMARIAPEKGLHLLCRAYIEQRNQGFLQAARLEVAGYLAPEHRGYLEDVRLRMRDAGLSDAFVYHGTLEQGEKLEFLQKLSALSVPATYDEPKGLFCLEAMSVGVPVVQPRRGAFVELLEKTGGGLLVDPDDPNSLGEGLRRLHERPQLAEELGRQGAIGVRQHFTSRHMAEATLRVFHELLRAERNPQDHETFP
jgi:glycosyltransferase involved in cell wall biosynthesis